MDPSVTSSTTTTTTPVPTVEVGQESGTPQHGPHLSRNPVDNNSVIPIYDNDLALFTPFDIDLLDSPLSLLDAPIASTESPIPFDFLPDEISYLNSEPNMAVGSLEDHIGSFSMDSNLLGFIADGEDFVPENPSGNDVVPVNPVVHQAQAGCIDDSTNVSVQVEQSMTNNGVVKKPMPLEKLVELAAVDPKRAKRIISNRESAARSKERKIHQTMEMEKSIQILQTQSDEMDKKLAENEKKKLDLKAGMKEMLCKIKSMEEIIKAREELNEALEDKVRRLKKENKQLVALKKKNNLSGIVSEFSSQLAHYQTSHYRSSQAQQHQQQQQLGMPSSHSDQPHNMQSDSKDSSFDSPN